VARIRYLTDEHVPSAVAKGLRARGVEVMTAVQAGTLQDPDPSVLTHARERGLVLITYDPDFLRLHAAGIPHAGIVYGTADMSVGAVIGRALLIAEVLDAEEMINHVEFL
jgi:predicted nuclease of predicted toxin-antitoxin system